MFSQFMIFSAKNNQNSKNFIENNKKSFFKLRRNYTGEKQFSLSLRKLDRTPAKFFSIEVSISFIIRSEKNSRERKMYDILSIEYISILPGFGYSRPPKAVIYFEPNFFGYQQLAHIR